MYLNPVGEFKYSSALLWEEMEMGRKEGRGGREEGKKEGEVGKKEVRKEGREGGRGRRKEGSEEEREGRRERGWERKGRREERAKSVRIRSKKSDPQEILLITSYPSLWLFMIQNSSNHT